MIVINENIIIDNEIKPIRTAYNKAFGTILFFFAVSRAVVLTASTIYGAMMISKGMTNDQITQSLTGMTFPLIILNLIMGIISYPLSISFGLKIAKFNLLDFFSVKNVKLKFVLKCIVVTLGFQAVGSIVAAIINMIGTSAGYELMTVKIETSTSLGYNVALFILACIFAPIFEELLFRGVVLRGLSKVSVIFGIIVSSAFFGLFHGNIPQAVAAFFMGLVLAFAAIKTGSIVPCMIMHFCANVNAVIQSAILQSSEAAAIVYNIILFITAITGAILMLVLDRKNFRLNKPLYSKGKCYKVLVTSVFFWIVLACFLFVIFTGIKKI